MRRIVHAWVGVALIALGSSSVMAITSAVVEHPHGRVEMRAANSADWTDVTPGDKLTQGASVRTSDDAQVDLVTTRGHRFHLKPGTRLTLTSLVDDQTAVHLDQGSVLSTVKKLKSNERFSIETPTAVCAVRGTQFETIAGERQTVVAVYRGIVGVALPASGAAETSVRAGMMTAVHDGMIELPHAIPRSARSAAESALARTARHEVGLDMTRTEVIASAALERRLADYQEGKSLIDVSGHRVRIEEYIVRPQPNQFKLVALDERDSNQLDYFFYLGTFNKNLPTDLSSALHQLSGTLGTSPEFYLTSYEMGQSNTQDSVHDTASGGHVVQITLDNAGNYQLIDPTDPGNTRTIQAVAPLGGNVFKVYDPLSDSFLTINGAQLASATRFGVYLPENDTFHDIAPGDTFFKTRFNTYDHDLDNISKISYVKSNGHTNILSSALDVTYTYAGGSAPTTLFLPDPDNLDVTITNRYADGTFESYRTVLIDDQGRVAPLSAFDSISTGAAYKNELLHWNYEQQVTATEFQGRKIDLVVEPKIFIESGLIQ